MDQGWEMNLEEKVMWLKKAGFIVQIKEERLKKNYSKIKFLKIS